MIVAGVDGCSAGWVALKVRLPSLATSIEVVDLPSWLKKRPPDIAHLGIDIPIGLFDRPTACDIAARKLLGWPRRKPQLRFIGSILGMKDVAAVSELLKPYDAGLMRCLPGSTRANSVVNDDEECSQPVEIMPGQSRLFS
jgi:hypothetical protein